MATAEILLQLVDYPDTRKSYYSRHVAGLPLHDSQHHFCYGPKYWRRYDKTVVRREYANQQYFEFRNEVVSLHTLNQFGFRGGGWDELGIDQTGIIVIGDSFVRGTLADDTETIPAFLDSWYRDLTFFNFGIGGHGPLQYFLTYEKYGNAVAHDIVILVLYLQNDAYDVREFESRLAKAEGLNSQDLNWVKIRTFLLDKVLAEFKIYNLAVASAGNIRQAVERHEELAETLVDSVEKFAQALRQEGKRTLIVTIPGRDFYDAVEFPKRQHQSAISLTETSIDRLNIFASNNINLALI